MAAKPKRSEADSPKRRNELLEALRAEAPARVPDSSQPKIVDTGIFKTALPRHRGHLIRWFLERREELPALAVASYFKDIAAAEIKKQGFPLNPKDDNLLKAPASVLEAYQCLDAYKQLLIRLKPFTSRRVVEAVAEALAEEYGELPRGLPTQVKEGLDKDTAADQIWKVIAAAVEVGMYGQRLEVRGGQYEREVFDGRNAKRAGRARQRKAQKTTEAIFRRIDHVCEQEIRRKLHAGVRPGVRGDGRTPSMKAFTTEIARQVRKNLGYDENQNKRPSYKHVERIAKRLLNSPE